MINNDDNDRSPDNDNGPVVQRDINKLSASGDAPPPSAVPGSAPPPGSAPAYNNGGGGITSLSSLFGWPSDGGGEGGNHDSNNHTLSGGGGMITFESMCHLSPTTMWHLQLAYPPHSPQESHLHNLGLEILPHRHPGKANAMMRAKS